VPPGDLPILIESIAEALTMPVDSLRDRGQAGRELLMQRFDRKALARKMISVYEAAVRNKEKVAQSHDRSAQVALNI
jgi:hypothetical protein